MKLRHAGTFVITVVAALALSCKAGPAVIGKKVNRAPLDAASAEKHKQLVAEGDAAWAERASEAKLREALAKWDEAVKIKQDDHETYTKLSRGAYLLADGFIFFEVEGNPAKEEEFLKTHEMGQAYAEQGLRALSPDYEKRVEGGIPMEDAIMVLGQEAVPLMYWFDVNLGKWAKFKGTDVTLKYKDQIFKIMSRVYELNPDYFYGAPDRYFGSYYAVAPSFAGGDTNKSREYFDKSLAKAPNYLATHVLIAEVLAPKLDDRALFERELKYVLEADANAIPEVAPEAMIEKKKAERLLKKADDIF
jgi:tetratricopeptide (TPR) repeat protein